MTTTMIVMVVSMVTLDSSPTWGQKTMGPVTERTSKEALTGYPPARLGTRRLTAIRLAKIPSADFEAAVDSAEPPGT